MYGGKDVRGYSPTFSVIDITPMVFEIVIINLREAEASPTQPTVVGSEEALSSPQSRQRRYDDENDLFFILFYFIYLDRRRDDPLKDEVMK